MSVATAHTIDARDLRYRYPGASAGPALRGASMYVDHKEITLLRGPSGSGKTTLLSALAGLLSVQGGRVVIAGREISALSHNERARFRLTCLGFIFQRFNLIGALSAAENVELPLRATGVAAAIARKRSGALLQRLGLKTKADRLPRQLSGGEQQRVAIARALITQPDIVFADEPTSSLDAPNGQQVTELLCALARESGSAVLIASHDERILPFVDRVITVSDGICS